MTSSSSNSGSGSVGLTGPAVSYGGTLGHLPTGYMVREFQIDRVLGEGGFSVVYLATDTRLERQVAIKEYMPTALATRNTDLSVNVRASAHHREAFEAGLRSFINEAKLLARFEHRALVKVHQFWQEKGTAYMVMPFYPGPTLKSWIKQHLDPVDPVWLEQFLRLVMDALETLHRENCLHRDVAPDNILILNGQSPLLLDFGAARRVIGDMTQALTVILKPGFAPIEQYAESQSMRQGPWTDVYALCAVAHFMITGRAPTPAVTRVLADDLVPLATVAAGRFPAPFLAALDAGLTVRPQQRPQSIAALRELMNGTAPEDNTLTAPPGIGMGMMGDTAPSAPVPTTIRPLMPTYSPPVGDHGDGGADDDRTRIAAPGDFAMLFAQDGDRDTERKPDNDSAAAPAADETATAHSPDLPADAPSAPAVEAATTTDDSIPVVADVIAQPMSVPPTVAPLTASSTVPPTGADALAQMQADPATGAKTGTGTAMRTGAGTGTGTALGTAYAPAPAAEDDDKPSPLPYIIGALAIAAVIGGAWALVNWMNRSFEASHTTSPPVAPATSPAPVNPAPATPAPAPAKAAPTANAAPAPVASAAAAAPAAPQASSPPPASTQTPAQKTPPAAATPPATVASPSASTPVAAKPAAEPAVNVAKNDADKKAAPVTPPPAKAAETKSVNAPPVAATKGGPPAPDAAKSRSSAPTGVPVGAPSSATPPVATAATPAPLPEPQVAPPVVMPPVATVDAMPPAQVAAVEPKPAAPQTPPSAAASPAPLRAVVKPDPLFPREAVRADVDKGKVRARLFVAADGSVSRVEIVSAQPVRVFDREVRETALRWRFDPPGQPRQTDIEFVFDRYKDR